MKPSWQKANKCEAEPMCLCLLYCILSTLSVCLKTFITEKKQKTCYVAFVGKQSSSIFAVLSVESDMPHDGCQRSQRTGPAQLLAPELLGCGSLSGFGKLTSPPEMPVSLKQLNSSSKNGFGGGPDLRFFNLGGEKNGEI